MKESTLRGPWVGVVSVVSYSMHHVSHCGACEATRFPLSLLCSNSGVRLACGNMGEGVESGLSRGRQGSLGLSRFWLQATSQVFVDFLGMTAALHPLRAW